MTQSLCGATPACSSSLREMSCYQTARIVAVALAALAIGVTLMTTLALGNPGVFSVLSTMSAELQAVAGLIFITCGVLVGILPFCASNNVELLPEEDAFKTPPSKLLSIDHSGTHEQNPIPIKPDSESKAPPPPLQFSPVSKENHQSQNKLNDSPLPVVSDQKKVDEDLMSKVASTPPSDTHLKSNPTSNPQHDPQTPTGSNENQHSLPNTPFAKYLAPSNSPSAKNTPINGKEQSNEPLSGQNLSRVIEFMSSPAFSPFKTPTDRLPLASPSSSNKVEDILSPGLLEQFRRIELTQLQFSTPKSEDKSVFTLTPDPFETPKRAFNRHASPQIKSDNSLWTPDTPIAVLTPLKSTINYPYPLTPLSPLVISETPKKEPVTFEDWLKAVETKSNTRENNLMELIRHFEAVESYEQLQDMLATLLVNGERRALFKMFLVEILSRGSSLSREDFIGLMSDIFTCLREDPNQYKALLIEIVKESTVLPFLGFCSEEEIKQIILPYSTPKLKLSMLCECALFLNDTPQALFISGVNPGDVMNFIYTSLKQEKKGFEVAKLIIDAFKDRFFNQIYFKINHPKDIQVLVCVWCFHLLVFQNYQATLRKLLDFPLSDSTRYIDAVCEENNFEKTQKEEMIAEVKTQLKGYLNALLPSLP